MAYRIPNKNPLDVNQRVAIGVSIPFNGAAVFNSTYTTLDQIKSNLINFILTNKGERVLNPNFGSNILKQLFNNITPTNVKSLQDNLTEELTTYFSYLTILDLIITPDYDSNSLQITLNYSLLGNAPEILNITI